MRKQVDVRLITLLIITFSLGLLRIFLTTKHAGSWIAFTPLGAMALFSGAYFSSRVAAYGFPLLVLLVSDMVLMNTVYADFRSGLLYSGWYWTYGGFFGITFVGRQIAGEVNLYTFLVACILAALVHYFISDFGVWLQGCAGVGQNPYSATWNGLISCFIEAFPSFRNMLLGNLIYGALLFGGFEIAQRRFPILQAKWMGY